MPLVTRLKSTKQERLRESDYLIDWDKRNDVSKPQTAVKDFLRRYWAKHVVTWETRIPGSLLRVDIMNWTLHVAVEVSPKKSHSYNAFFHRHRARYGAAMQHELDKAEWLESNGFVLCEVFDEDIPVLSRQWFREKYNVDLTIGKLPESQSD
jgi:hypothetical protein